MLKIHSNWTLFQLRFKTQLERSDLFDPRLLDAVVARVDVAYGGPPGFSQAIELSGDVLSNVKFVQEKKIISAFFEEVDRDTGKLCFGVDDTLCGLEQGAVEVGLLFLIFKFLC